MSDLNPDMTTKVFVSHASEDHTVAEEIALALRGAGFDVFFDEKDLPPGGDYHARIRGALTESAYLVFVISPDSVTRGRYTMSELTLAQERWAYPRERVLPVMVRETPRAKIPSYLKAVTILDPKGSPSAEVASALQNMANRSSDRSARTYARCGIFGKGAGQYGSICGESGPAPCGRHLDRSLAITIGNRA